MRLSRPHVLLATLVMLQATAAVADADRRQWEIGLRLDAMTAGGVPSNDIMGFGVYGRYHLTPRWKIGFALDSVTGDFEKPYEQIGISSPAELDSQQDTLIASSWFEGEYGKEAGRIRWFWMAGLGLGSPSVDDLTGPTTSGGTFDITTEAGTEFLVSGGGGFKCRIGERWRFELALKIDRHFADWKLTDRVSGRTGTLEDYTTKGLYAGLTIAF